MDSPLDRIVRFPSIIHEISHSSRLDSTFVVVFPEVPSFHRSGIYLGFIFEKQMRRTSRRKHLDKDLGSLKRIWKEMLKLIEFLLRKGTRRPRKGVRKSNPTERKRHQKRHQKRVLEKRKHDRSLVRKCARKVQEY